MKCAIMQPYFLPYLGYFQLISSVDKFVLYDNIQFTKKGWINRNRFLLNGKDELFTLTLKKDSDYLDIYERTLSDSFEKDALKIFNRMLSAYQKATFFIQGKEVLEQCLFNKERNLFKFIYHSLLIITEYLDIETEIIISSTIDSSRELKSQDRVIDICKKLKSDQYVNPCGGIELYDANEFKKNGLELFFIKMNQITYAQGKNINFVPSLSIIDVIMWNDVASIREMLHCYKFC